MAEARGHKKYVGFPPTHFYHCRIVLKKLKKRTKAAKQRAILECFSRNLMVLVNSLTSSGCGESV